MSVLSLKYVNVFNAGGGCTSIYDGRDYLAMSIRSKHCACEKGYHKTGERPNGVNYCAKGSPKKHGVTTRKKGK